MIRSAYRFHGHGSLKYVFSKGATSRSKHLILRSIVNTYRKKPRVAVVVSKKVLKSAVGRNRIRRRIFAAINPLLKEIVIPTDIVFVVTSAEVRSIESNELVGEIQTLLENIMTPDK